MLTRFGRHNSLGLYCGMLTQYLGYQMTNDEYKVMGLSSYGSQEYLDKFAKWLTRCRRLFMSTTPHASKVSMRIPILSTAA